MKVSMLFPNGVAKAVTLSFDDGVWQDVRLMEIIDKYGIRCTFNLSSGFTETVNHAGRQYPRLTREESVKIYKNTPHEVAVHGYAHPNLSKKTDEEAAWEITEDRRNLEEDYCMPIRGMAYPYGIYDDRIVDITRRCGIVYARTIKSTYGFDMPAEWLELDPTCHYHDSALMELAERFVNLKTDKPQMFYLWGHAFEFDSFNDWSKIEKFCELVGGRDDIWYATNIEICDYARAYERLEWSADMTRVFNPTAYRLWFKCENGRILGVNSGETVNV